MSAPSTAARRRTCSLLARVGRRSVAVVDAPAALVWFLDEQGHSRDVGQRDAVDASERAPGPETGAVIGGNHEEHAIEESHALQPVHQPLDEGIGVLDLQKMTLVRLDDRPLRLYPSIDPVQSG
jgi:hypothetical protein